MCLYPDLVPGGVSAARRRQVGAGLVSKGIRIDGAIVIGIHEIVLGRWRMLLIAARVVVAVVIPVRVRWSIVVIIIVPALLYYNGRLYIYGRIAVWVIIR